MVRNDCAAERVRLRGKVREGSASQGLDVGKGSASAAAQRHIGGNGDRMIASAHGLSEWKGFLIVSRHMDTRTTNTVRWCGLFSMAKRSMAAALCFALVCGFAPVSAHADETIGVQNPVGSSLLSCGNGTAAAYVSVVLGEPEGAPEGGDCNKYNFYSGLPWCGHFVVWCARAAGVSSDVIPDVYNCEAMAAFFQQRGQWHDASYIPDPGDLIFYTYGYGITHVGVVTSVDGAYVYTREGNTNHEWCGQVGSFARPVGTADTGGWGHIAGYASPGFEGEDDTHLFGDTPKGSWYVDQGYLDYVVESGLMSGYSDGSGMFGPDDEVKRGQVIVILHRAVTGATSANVNNDVDTPFSDIARGSYAAAAAAWAYENGISQGYLDESGQPTGVFGVDDPVTREQLAALVARCAQTCGIDVSVDVDAAFATVQGVGDLSSFAIGPMAWCVANGIISGDVSYSPAALLPQNTAARCEMAKIATIFDRDVL